MTLFAYGGPMEIPLVKEQTAGDVFENAIRKIGVVSACEWFGHEAESEFTEQTIAILLERSSINGKVEALRAELAKDRADSQVRQNALIRKISDLLNNVEDV